MLKEQELYAFLEEKHALYNCPSFIPLDPVSIPHLFSGKEDIEIAGFFSATIAWGQRVTVLNNAKKLMEWMDMTPCQFILHHTEKDLKPFKSFVHRTFNGEDCLYFIEALRYVYLEQGGLENAFSKWVKKSDTSVAPAIIGFNNLFFGIPHPARTRKHVSNPQKGASAKRLCMYLRWMVRKDNCGVDFGIWNKIKPSQLSCPLDVHSGRVARKLGLLQRKQDDWQAVTELTEKLKTFSAQDPVKYDFSLFGLGVNEKF